MPRPGELSYFEVIGEGGRNFAVNKPFSEEACASELMQVGAVLALLPRPPARVLECGCGTGWLSHLLRKRGYQVLGTDVSEQAIDLARSNPVYCNLEPPEFQVADSEDLPFADEFDAVIFYDSLHHSVNELEALRSAYQALKPGGVCIASEPGVGHEARSRDVIAKYDVTEKDMPPKHVIKLGRLVGFERCRAHARVDHVGRLLYTSHWQALGRLSRWINVWPVRYLAILGLLLFMKGRHGLTVMHKPKAPKPKAP